LWGGKSPSARTKSTFAPLQPAPLNVFIRPGLPSIAELHALGVARLSLATAPILATLGLLRKISRELLETGTYTALQADAVAYP
jgi:2-methylisocitrate lyase-like PEP mutase family enzyme